MTENQLFPMSAEFFDTSSNSSNPLKCDLFSLGLSNSSNCSLGASLSTLSPTHTLSVPTSTATSSSNTSLQNSCPVNSSASNITLTNAIKIPRSNNPNQSHNPYFDESHHHPTPSPLHQMMSSSNLQHHQNQHQRLLVDLSDCIGLDTLESSLSPTLLQDVSLSDASPVNKSHQNTNTNGNLSTDFNAQKASPLDQCGYLNNEASSFLGNLNVSGSATLTDAHNTLIYEIPTHADSLWSNNMDNSLVSTTKTEPFSFEEDYIFPIDKNELSASGFPDINDDNFLLAFEEFLPTNQTSTAPCFNTLTGGFLLTPNTDNTNSFQQLNSPQASPAGPPQQLLQQQQLQQQQHNQALPQLQTLLTQQQQRQQQLQSNAGGIGAIHHTSHNHHNSSSPYEIYHSTPNKQQLSSPCPNTFSPVNQSSNSPLQINSITPPPHTNRSQCQQPLVRSRNMQELMKKGFSMSPDRNSSNLLGHSVPVTQMLLSGMALSPSSGSSGYGSSTTGGCSGTASGPKSVNYPTDSSISRLSSSAPTHLGLEHIWKRREPRQHLLSTGSLAEAESFSSLSTGSVLSPDNLDFSQDDDDGSTDYNSDNCDDFSSDNGSDNEDDGRSSSTNQLSSSKGKERYFWQYNVQAKGPKGKRLVFQSKLEDPHVLNEVTDPVFSPNCSVRGIKVFKHSGKARKGDGNDLTPNPHKLHKIGKELDKLNRTINDMTPVSELPFNVRPKSRKEKNKLASRACRLKKKAQHEANKIKLFGLEIEHKKLLTGIAEIKQALAVKYSTMNLHEANDEINQKIESIYTTATTGLRIAGTTTDFVNRVLENVRSGVPNGGLEEIKNSS